MSYRYSPLDSQYPSSPITAILLDDDVVFMNPYLAVPGADAHRIGTCLKPFFHGIHILHDVEDVVEKIKEFSSIGWDCVLLVDGTFHEPKAIELREVQRAHCRRSGHADHAEVDAGHDRFEGLICDAAAAREELQQRLGKDGVDLRDVPLIAISWSTDARRIDRMQTAGFGAFVEKCDHRHASGLFVALAHVLRHQHRNRLYADWMPFFLKLKLAQDDRGRSVFMNPGKEYLGDKCIIFPLATPPSSNSFAMC